MNAQAQMSARDMNAQAQMSGQVSGRMTNQANQQMAGLSQQKGMTHPTQMNGRGTQIMDNLNMSRHHMRTRITQFLQKRTNNPYAEQRLHDLAKKLEDYMFKNAASVDDYMNMTVGPIEQRLQSILKSMPNNSHPLSQHTSSSSLMSTMIPTPGMTHNSNTNAGVACSAENPMVTSGGSGRVAQTALNSGKFRPIANGSAGVGHNASFHTSDGSVPNRYQQLPVNMAVVSGENSMASLIGISRPLNQMIPTPGLNNLQQISSNSTNRVGFSQQQQQQQQQLLQQQQQLKQYVASQNTRTPHAQGGQIGVGSKSSLQQKASYEFSNGVVNGGLGLIGNSMYMMNGQGASESYLNTTSSGSPPKPLQQQFDQQHQPPILPTSLSQQMLPMAGDGYGMNTTALSVSDNLYGSSMDDQNLNNISLNSKLKSNHAFSSHNSSLQSMQHPPHVKSQYGNPQKMNFQSPQSREHLLQSQEQIQNFQQHSNQAYGQFVQNQHQQEQKNPQQQKLLLKADNLRQNSLTSNFGGQLISEHGIEAAGQFHLQELQSQYQQSTSAGNDSRGAHYLDHLAGAKDSQPALRQASKQISQRQQQVTASELDYSSLHSGPEPDVFQCHPQALQKSQKPEEPSSEQHMQEVQQRLTGWEEAQQPRFDGCTTGHAAATKNVSAPQSSSGIACGLGKYMRERNYFNLRRWLYFLFHAHRCSAPEGTCKDVHCISVKQLLKHISSCKLNQCAFRYCCDSRKLLGHVKKCDAAGCPLCIPMRDFMASKRKTRNRPFSGDDLANQSSDSSKAIGVVVTDSVVAKTGTSLCETSEDRQSMKRMKLQHTDPSLVPKRESSPISVPVVSQPHLSHDSQPQRADTTISTKPKAVEVTIDSYSGFGQGKHTIFANTVDQSVHVARLDTKLLAPKDVNLVKEEIVLIEADNDQVKVEVEPDANGPSDPVAGSKSGKPKIKGVSLTELFTPEQIREHIHSLRQWVGQSKAKAEKNQAMEHLMTENSCQLCAVEKLAFEPPPIYCTPCGARIKRNAAYYTIGTGDTRHYFCVPCYNEARGDTVVIDGSSFPKMKLEKKKNDEESEEWWVQCDKCEAWQHQICALFNGRRNDGGQAEYTCPNCYIDEIERGERKPLPQSAVLGAKDLPRTILSDHIEQRLFKRLKHERQERARHLGKSFDEVPGAESLVVRVVSSVDKKLEVKQRFLEIFQEENYPTEFPYKSKVVLLFQKIEGVEVCLFGMYVQEFGSECQFPNQRRVYLSYLDSVKYFRPETRTVSGEALRTFVYHEILIGYLEYCKKRGFTSCYIWACPPLKGEDYILYCHPEIQKTPKSDKLREWYLSMLRKACKENIVVDLINLYDHFFTSVGECKAKVTAARLPYFDGDYWPGAAEDMINQLSQEEDGKKQQKKGKTKKTITKRALKAAGQTDLTGNASKDALLMQKLGETISPMKEDFIMVHLQHACTHCCLLMVSGIRWVCKYCKNFQLCDKCHDTERRLEERDRHPVNSREKHMLCPIEITDVSSDTKDKDEILESEFFDTRQAFLSLCQGNHYQYDTLRRAKHSSMMVLYHLHNPTAPAFVTTCYVCHHDIENGQGWRCEICPDFDVCNTCYQKDGAVDHPHKLTNHPSLAERDAQNQEARQKRVLQLRKMLDLLVHASQCRTPQCPYPNCRKVKGLFRHGIQCKTRASGGCHLCKKMWYLLQLHSRACKESNCHVPRCKDLKEHLRRLQQQSESRRRAAVMEMMRQRAAEVAGSSE